MATLPESPSPTPQHSAGRSWSALVAAARQAPAPRVNTSDAVLAAIAADQAMTMAPAARAEEATGNDGWTEFARMFATPRWVFSSAASFCAAGPLALWVLSAGVAQMDAFAKFLVYGGLPGWLVAIVA